MCSAASQISEPPLEGVAMETFPYRSIVFLNINQNVSLKLVIFCLLIALSDYSCFVSGK